MVTLWPPRISAAAFLILSAAAAAAPSIAELSGCREIVDATARLQCYDRTFDALAAQSANGQPGEAQFGLAPEVVEETVREVLGIDELEAIEAGLVAVERVKRRLHLRLDNDQVWQQIDSVKLVLRAGDRVRVRSAAAGSFLLEKLSGSRSIRVRRLE